MELTNKTERLLEEEDFLLLGMASILFQQCTDNKYLDKQRNVQNFFLWKKRKSSPETVFSNTLMMQCARLPDLHFSFSIFKKER